MPPAPPFPSQNGVAANNALFPALYLYPLNDTWIPKHIALTSQHTKIGRQTSSKTAPGERNGFFDSKVLSRQHAEVWEEGGKIFIKDVKSSNGTFINGERLSSEGHESEPFELKSDDIVEFGIDIVGEDNKTIIHHKVAARVVCVFTEQDAQVAARAEQHQQQQLQQHQYLQQQQQVQQHLQQSASGQQHPAQGHPLQHAAQQTLQQVGAAPNANGGLSAGANGAPQNFQFAAQRRAHVAQQGLGSMGVMRPPGKTGLSFDVILSRLQGEVQKSKETTAELNSLSGSMNEIHDTLSGTLPTNLPPFPAHLPPVRPPQEAPSVPPPAPQPIVGGSSTSENAAGVTSATTSTTASISDLSSTGKPLSASPDAAAVVSELQSQLRETQSSLAVHLDKVRALEGVLAEQEVIRREVGALRELVEVKTRNRSSSELLKGHHQDLDEEYQEELHLEEEEGSGESDDDDDDARSTSTTMPHELERVDEEDEEQLAAEAQAEDERQRTIRDSRRLDSDDQEGEELDPEEDHFRPRDSLPSHSDEDAEEELASDQERREIALRREEDARLEAETLAAASSLAASAAATSALLDGEKNVAEGFSAEQDAEERRREDLAVGRPHTPEPSRAMGLIGMGGSVRRRSLSSPLSQVSVTALKGDEEDEEDYEPNAKISTTKSRSPTISHAKGAVDETVQEQVKRLSQQVGAVLALTTSLEAQHAAAQGTIVALESKVSTLETMLRNAEEALKNRAAAPSTASTSSSISPDAESSTTPDAQPVQEKESLTALLAAWKTSVEGQWGTAQQEWTLERERLARAREEWEARKTLWDAREASWTANARAESESTKGIQAVLAEHQTAIRDLQLRSQQAGSSSAGDVHLNGDASLKHHGGLVTPPSPRSQSSDSGRYGGRRRRRRSSGSRRHDSSRSHSPESERHYVDEPSSTLEDDGISSGVNVHDSQLRHRDAPGEHGIARGLGLAAATAAGSVGVSTAAATAAARSLATPDSSVYKLSGSIGSLDGTTAVGSVTSSPTKAKLVLATRENSEDSDPQTLLESLSTGNRHGNDNAKGPPIPLNVQTAMGVVLLSVAAAAVFWKVAPE